MATPTVWKNVAVRMQSAIAASVTVTAISKASPAVVSAAGHGFSAGDIVYLECVGMHQLNEKVARVANPATDTFELEGVDSTLFDDFSSGTVQRATLGTSIVTATTINSSGGEFDFIDTTTIHDNAKKQMPGLPSAISFEFDHIWDASDPGLLAMKSASDVQGKRVFEFQFGTGGKKVYFAGYVGCSMLPGGQAQGLVTTKAVITMNGTPTYYAS
ncbi:hypothetical protein JWJ90_13575 [Desulfobulbus rhabdoformis]|jgi:hypothetical protein|uniref:phage tail tube protein n=1 Tax=Desulfobulbus rhabdoformis TaxID=34032 RepID=UPI001965F644|nr:phage tail tube protein [Desulfobulbus rhabdoformis]MBM9615309.1 hypothetical protein [Desulfobulbus rhabdoformis]